MIQWHPLFSVFQLVFVAPKRHVFTTIIQDLHLIFLLEKYIVQFEDSVSVKRRLFFFFIAKGPGRGKATRTILFHVTTNTTYLVKKENRLTQLSIEKSISENVCVTFCGSEGFLVVEMTVFSFSQSQSLQTSRRNAFLPPNMFQTLLKKNACFLRAKTS